MPTIPQIILMFLGLVALVILAFGFYKAIKTDLQKQRKRNEKLKKRFGSSRVPYPKDKFEKEQKAFYEDMRKRVY